MAKKEEKETVKKEPVKRRVAPKAKAAPKPEPKAAPISLKEVCKLGQKYRAAVSELSEIRYLRQIDQIGPDAEPEQIKKIADLYEALKNGHNSYIKQDGADVSFAKKHMKNTAAPANL